MLSNIAAQVQQLIGDRTKLQADLLLLILLDELWMLQYRVAMSNAFRIQEQSVIEVAVLGVVGTTSVQQRLAGMKHERYAQASFFTGLLECREHL